MQIVFFKPDGTCTVPDSPLVPVKGQGVSIQGNDYEVLAVKWYFSKPASHDKTKFPKGLKYPFVRIILITSKP